MKSHRRRRRERLFNKHTGAALGLALGITAGSLLLNLAESASERSQEHRAAQHVDGAARPAAQVRTDTAAGATVSSMRLR